MKTISALLFLFTTFSLNAQVKFEQVNVKNKNAYIVYTGTINTFSIKLPQAVSVKNITSSIGNLKMMDTRTFVLYVQEYSETPVELKYTMVKNGVETEEVYPVKYSVQLLPDYFRLRIGGYTKSGKVSIAGLRKNHKIGFNDADFNGDLKNISITFDFKYLPAKGKQVEMRNLSSIKKDDVMVFDRKMQALKKGDQLLFENIKAVMDNGNFRNMENLSLEIQ